MFKLSPEFKQNYYNFIYKHFNLEKQIKLLPVDFSKPWYQILIDQKWNLSVQIFSEVIQSVFSALTPVILGIAFFNNKPEFLYYFAIVFIVLEIINRQLTKYLSVLILQSTNSINYEACKFFLTVDPIYHSTKSSGQILSKINKATSDFEILISALVEVLLSSMVSFITVLITIATFDYRLGIVGFVSFVLIASSNSILNYLNAQIFKKRRIKAEDEAKAESTETLVQNGYIRAAFASNEQLLKLKNKLINSIAVTSVARQTFGVTRTVVRIVYAISTLSIGLVLYNLVSINQISTGIAVSLLLAYFNGSAPILRLGDLVRNILELVSRQEDLFKFIRQFGVQTYPVLIGDVVNKKFQDKLNKLESEQIDYNKDSF